MVPNLPVEVLEHIFSFLDSKVLITKCRPVCKRWQALVDESILVRRALKTVQLRQRFQLDDFDFKHYFQISHSFEKNLLKNPLFQPTTPNLLLSFIQSIRPTSANRAEILHWTTKGPFARERPSIGASFGFPLHILRQNGFESMDALPVVATSHGQATQEQVVLMDDCNLDPLLMDRIQPTILAEEWIGTRFDCGNIFTLTIQLFRGECSRPFHQKSIRVYTEGGGCGQWRKVSMSVKNYGPGVRRIRYIRQGVDSQFWNGNYGTKFALASLSVHLPTLACSQIVV